MIASLRGRIISKKFDGVIVDVNGVGYYVNVPLTLISMLPDEGKDIFLYIYTYVREDSIQLYGFYNEDEKRMFIDLLGISGIGPRLALNILSTIPVDKIQSAIDSEDIASLCRVPGLGKKTAHRLILELKGKLPSLEQRADALFEDTLSALINLGYKRNIAKEALDKAYKNGHRDIESLLKESLRYLTKD